MAEDIWVTVRQAVEGRKMKVFLSQAMLTRLSAGESLVVSSGESAEGDAYSGLLEDNTTEYPQAPEQSTHIVTVTIRPSDD